MCFNQKNKKYFYFGEYCSKLKIDSIIYNNGKINLVHMKHHKLPFLGITLGLILSTHILNAQGGDPSLTEVWEPVPEVVTPGDGQKPPSDAIVLFDGKNLDQWKGKDGAAKWEVKNGIATVVGGAGDIETKQEFGDIQLHIEWRTPKKVESEGQGRGNSGIFFQGMYELQVLDSYENATYVNGMAGSIYKQTPPLVNATKSPGEWQTYDVIYRAPKFSGEELVSPAKVTVLLNGVLIHDNTEIQGTTEYIGPPKIISHGKGPLKLQDHGNPVSYRNIWVRELR